MIPGTPPPPPQAVQQLDSPDRTGRGPVNAPPPSNAPANEPRAAAGRHLTYRFWALSSAAFIGIAFSLMARDLSPLAFCSPCLGALVFSLMDGWWPQARVENPQMHSQRAIEGDELGFSIDVVADRTMMVELELQFSTSLHPLTPTRFVEVLNGRQRLDVSLQAQRWGSDGPEWAFLITSDRLGITKVVERVALYSPVRVHPPAERLTSLVPLYKEHPIPGEHRARSRGPGSELAEVRPYRFGDPVRMIHPRLTARRGVPMVVERHPERSSDIVLLIDSAQDLGVDLDTTLRWTVTAAMALCERHLNAQDRVGLIDLGRVVRWLPARLGRKHLHQIVDSLLATEVLPRRQSAATYVKPENLPRSATIVAISPLLSELTLTALVDLRSRGHEILVIKPTIPPPSALVDPLALRIFRVGNELNERWLIERGSIVIPWEQGDSIENIMRTVITNLGRARQRV